MTLGIAFLLLANIEGRKYKIMSFFSTFGKVPLFYYILHAYVIHLLAIFISRLAGFNYGNILPALGPDFVPDYLKGYGYSLLVVYVVWIFVVLLIYPICLFYNRYKEAHKEKWWLSYL
jgi:ABC-type spermidine/putrescine transport system permease subunit I